jgi:DNA-binding SARP family transcriptional activator
MLKVYLFGSGHARYKGKSLPGFPHLQPCLLLCYLLLNSQYPQSREQLATIFWGDYSNRIARKYLRNALWRLRQTFQDVGAKLDQYLLINEDYVSVIGAEAYWLDTAAFDRAIKQSQDIRGHELDEAMANELESAVELYAGDLLEGIYEECYLYERERLRLAYLNVLGKLLEYHACHSNFESGITCGKRILSLDKTREKIHRQMMCLYCLAGERNAALAQYNKCKQILREELDIEPMAETRQLNKMIINGQFNPQLWTDYLNPPLFSNLPNRGQMPPIAKHSIKTLRRLQKMIDETGKELRILERLISQALANTDH